MNNCKNCYEPASGNYCSNCGQTVELRRIDAHYITHEIQHLIHFERGILYTIKELLINPGKNIRQFITENRRRLVKPIIFIIVTSLIYTVINNFFHIEEGYINVEHQQKNTVNMMNKWIQEHYGYSNLIMGIFIALWIKLFFGKYKYNFFEILILLCFTMGMGMLIFAVFAIIQGITHINLFLLASVIGIIYCTWAIGQFFEKKKAMSYLKAFASYILGMITFSISVVVVGTLIDLIIK